jgi:hypothetical protein
MTSDEYLSHCRAVVSFRQIIASDQQWTYIENFNSNRESISIKQWNTLKLMAPSLEQNTLPYYSFLRR